MAELKYKQYETKVKNLQDENRQKDRVINELKLTIGSLEEELRKAEEKIERLENTERDLRREAR